MRKHTDVILNNSQVSKAGQGLFSLDAKHFILPA